jgi:3-hydroxyisobutyrate dehydrogenase-like beta-hydroxyacid dehydrogenase
MNPQQRSRKMTDVTMLGMGNMGRALAEALLGRGHKVTVWNRTAERLAPLVERGARPGASVADAIGDNALVLICVLDYAAVRETLTGVDLAGRTIVNLTSGTPQAARDMGAWIAERGGTYLDAGIMAVPEMIGTQQATVLYSGVAAAFEAHTELLAVFGDARYLGEDFGLAPLLDFALLSGMYGMFGGMLTAFAMVRGDGRQARELAPMLRDWIVAMSTSIVPSAEQIDTAGHILPGDAAVSMHLHALDAIISVLGDNQADPVLLEPMQRLLRRHVQLGRGAESISGLVDLLLTPDGTIASVRG